MWEKINDFLERYVENTIGFTFFLIVFVFLGSIMGITFTSNFLYWLFGCLGGGLILTLITKH